MKNTLIYSFAIIMFFSLLSCEEENKHDGFTINGTLTNSIETDIFLERISTKKVAVVDTGRVDAEGKFTLLGKTTEDAMYRIKIGRQEAVFPLIGKETINFSADAKNLPEYTITGSPLAASFGELFQKARKRQLPAQDVKNFIDSTKHPVPALFLMGGMNFQKDKATYEKLAGILNGQNPNSDYTIELDAFLKQQAQQTKSNASQMGQAAPEIAQPNPDGEIMKLSDLKGKVVLVDFWAAWCGPCRRENPNVVSAYNKYKDQGFTVYSVSLDKTKDRWVGAIKQDGLIWDTHVSDLKFWSSQAAKDYGVRSIPAAFLLDREGNIVAKNLRGAALHTKIKEVLAN